ncbi:MAG: copper resistance protein NlpE N-terminal domain-containing protein [Rubrivivax sp.]|nr:copper resistance protein NlpE N-terminal domain-containing protein [Rubrivivax sp.]
MRLPFTLAMALAVALAGCAQRQQDWASAANNPDPAHSSRDSLDWPGVYEGITPCADCPGIKMRLTLRHDGSYELSTQYLERQAEPQTVRGRFSWSADDGSIKLDAAGQGRQFRVGEGRLLQLNADGSAPPWNTPNRVLTQQPAK